MKKFIEHLKLWNKVYEDVCNGLLSVSICDDESGHLEYDDYSKSYDDMTIRIFDFRTIKDFLDSNPEQYRKDNPLDN